MRQSSDPPSIASTTSTFTIPSTQPLKRQKTDDAQQPPSPPHPQPLSSNPYPNLPPPPSGVPLPLPLPPRLQQPLRSPLRNHMPTPMPFCPPPLLHLPLTPPSHRPRLSRPLHPSPPICSTPKRHNSFPASLRGSFIFPESLCVRSGSRIVVGEGIRGSPWVFYFP